MTASPLGNLGGFGRLRNRGDLGSLRGLWKRWEEWDHVATPVLAWIVARIAVGAALLVAVIAADELRPGDRPVQVDQRLLAWDGTWYDNIAENGYDGVAREGLRFFPLVPLLARWLSVVLPGDTTVALVAITNASALVLALLLYRLVELETGDRSVANRSVWLVSLVPPAYVLVMGYAESTMMALSVGAFLYLRRQRWWAAAVLGVLAGLTRPAAVALAVPAVVEGLRHRAGVPMRRLVPRLAAAVAPIAGAGIYLAWVGARYGDWLLPLRVHAREDLRGAFVDPVTRIWRAARDMLGGDVSGAGLHFPWVVIALVLLVVAFRRLPASYGLFAASLVIVALTGESLGSFERYALSAFPLVVAGAFLIGRVPVERAVLGLAGVGVMGFAALAFLGAYVP